jgi:hypothetical protein
MPVSRELPLPLFVLIRGVDYDEPNDTLHLSRKEPALTIIDVTSGIEMTPLFTTSNRALVYRNYEQLADKVVRCDAPRLIDVLTTIAHAQVCIDPDPGVPPKTGCYSTDSLIAFLRKKIADAN